MNNLPVKVYCEGCGYPFFKDKVEIPEISSVIKGYKGTCPACNKKLEIKSPLFKVS